MAPRDLTCNTKSSELVECWRRRHLNLSKGGLVDRRTVLAGLAALASFAAANAEEPRKELRIGYQKTGALLVVKA